MQTSILYILLYIEFGDLSRIRPIGHIIKSDQKTRPIKKLNINLRTIYLIKPNFILIKPNFIS
jgi:hypothetical protein